MATQFQEDDLSQDLVDPTQAQADLTAQQQAAVTSAPDAFRQNNATAASGLGQFAAGLRNLTGNQTVGDPRIVQALAVQQKFKDILADSNASAPSSESPMDKQLRQAQALSIGMADINPQLSLKANSQAIAIQQAKLQQSRLSAETDLSQSQAQEAQLKAATDKVTSGVVIYDPNAKDKNGLPDRTALARISLYSPDGTKNTDFNTQYQAALQAAKAKGVDPGIATADQFDNGKIALQNAKGQYQLQVQLQKDQDKASLAAAAANIDSETVKYYAAQSAFDQTALSRQPPAVRNAVTAYKAAQGLTPIDEQMARAEIKGLQSGERAIGTRVGNTTILQNEMQGLGQNVLDAMGKVDRTRIPVVNAMIKAGATNFGSPAEAAYAAAVQAFTTSHGRLISGATGVTTDAARDQASSLVTTSQAPDAVRAAIAQIVGAETPVIRNAADNAIEVMANPKRYAGMIKVAEKLGYPLSTFTSQAAPSSNSSVAATPATQSGPGTTGLGSQLPTPLTNVQGWTLHQDKNGNKAYVSPDGKNFQTVQ